MNNWNLTQIPKIAHFYWHGEMLSWLRYLTLETFQRQNPDWELRFYTPKIEHQGESNWEEHSKERTGVIGKNYLEEAKQLPNTTWIELTFNDNMPDVYRSDLLRLKLLGEDGGLWLDMDVISFRPMTEGIFNQPEIDTVLSYSLTRNHYSIGFLMGSVKNPFYKFLYNKGIESKPRKYFSSTECVDRQKYGIILWDSYFKNLKEIEEYFTDLKIFNIEFSTCYPYLYNNMDYILKIDAPINDDIIAIHWYAGHPLTRNWEILLTPENYLNYNTTLCNCIKKGLA